MRMVISREEKLLINILFKNKVLTRIDFQDIDYGKLVQISSGHLMLPSLYINLKKKSYLNYIPEDLSKYLKKIYSYNRDRNKILLKEIEHISSILNSKNIDYVFIKGSSLILNNSYKDIGERMVGDIDILINKNQIKEGLKTIQSYSYKSNYSYKIWKPNVYPNHINKNKIFSLDIHTELFPSNNLICNKKYLSNYVKTENGIKISKLENEIISSIFNYQIDDYGYLKSTYSYRKIYDIFLILQKKKSSINNYKEEIIVKRFFQILNYMNITNIKYKNDLRSIIYLKRFELKMKNKFYYLFDKSICDFIILIDKFHMKILEFMFNSNYRNKVKNKILDKY